MKKLLLSVSLLALYACAPSTKVIKETTITSPSSTSSTGTTTGSTSTGGNPLPYTFDIISHGKNGGIISWSSATDPSLQSTTKQLKFQTDSYMKIRVRAKASPGKGVTNYGQSCLYDAVPYTKLQVQVQVKAKSAVTAYDTYTFDDISVGSVSEGHEFEVPASSTPLEVRVLNVKWDWSCIYNKNNSLRSYYCPWDYVWPNDCFQVQLEMATDYTQKTF